MNRSIEQAILSLLPTHNSAVPQPLAELASSLLAQSRHRASTLKAEEEIARPYACAHIACDRLKITLNLPPIDPRPPIPPRIYKRLYNHLEKILPASSSTPGRATPRGRASESRTGTPSSKLRTTKLIDSPTARKGAAKASPSPSHVTPSRTKSLAHFRGTPKVASAAKLSSYDALPPWMRPCLRFVCKEHGHDNIGPVVMSGVESIVAPNGVMTEDKWVQDNLTSLLGALYLYIWRALKWPGEDLVEAEYIHFRKQLVASLNKARQLVTVKAPPVAGAGASGSPLKRKLPDPEEEEAAWKGWHTVRSKDLDTAAVYVNRQGWMDLDWAKGIQDLVARAADDEEGSDEEGEPSPEGPLQMRRTDTMLQERYDYLSERRLKEYGVWERDIMDRIKELQSASQENGDEAGDAMDVDDNE